MTCLLRSIRGHADVRSITLDMRSFFARPSLEEADVIQNQVVAQDFIGKRGSAVNVSNPYFATRKSVVFWGLWLPIVCVFSACSWKHGA